MIVSTKLMDTLTSNPNMSIAFRYSSDMGGIVFVSSGYEQFECLRAFPLEHRDYRFEELTVEDCINEIKKIMPKKGK